MVVTYVNSSSASTDAFHRHSRIFQRPVCTLQEEFLLRVHEFGLCFSNAKKLVIELIKAETKLNKKADPSKLKQIPIYGLIINLKNVDVYPSIRAALVVCVFPGLLSSASYQKAVSNLSAGISAVQFLPSNKTLQKLSNPSPKIKTDHLKTTDKQKHRPRHI